LKDLVIVDGYNFIFNYFSAKKISSSDLLYLREKLISDLVKYKHWSKCDLLVIFDAKSSDNIARNYQKIDDIEVVYSRSGETADTIIEELVCNRQGYRRIFVVTSDYMQQKVVFKRNVYRKSIREFVLEINRSKRKIREKIDDSKKSGGKLFYLLENRLDRKSKKKFSDFRKSSKSKKQ